VIDHAVRKQGLAITGQLPDAIVACVDGGNAMGIPHAFLNDGAVELIGVEVD